MENRKVGWLLTFIALALFMVSAIAGADAPPGLGAIPADGDEKDEGRGPDRVVTSAAPERLMEAPPCELLLKAGPVTPQPGLSPRLQERAAREEVGPTYVIVQFYEPLTELVRSELADLGVEIVEYIPQRAFICSVDLANMAQLAGLVEVRAVAEIRAEWKISPPLLHHMAARPDELVEVWIVAFAPIDELLPQATLLDEWLYEMSLDYATMMELAHVERVKWVEERPVERLLLAESVPLVGANRVWDRRTGSGVGVGVIDSGIDPAHFGAGGHFENANVVYSYDWVDEDWYPFDGHGHGTHVAGTIGGWSAPGGQWLIGASPLGTLVVQRVFDDAGNWHGGAYADIFDYAAGSGASILNNSWGHDSSRQYNLGARRADQWAYDNPHELLVFANGNWPRFTNMGSPALAKNVVAVGALHDGSLNRVSVPTVDHTSASLADVSSILNNLWAPEDGRIKPDIMAPGVNTAAPVVGTWDSWSGTSMAAPHVSGLAALFREQYPARPAPVIKAALMATAIDLDDKQGQSAYPTGWGKVPSARDMLYKNPWEHTQFFFSGGVAHGQQAEHTFEVPAGTEKVVVSLVWWDPPASELADPAQVNALDLYVGPVGDPHQHMSIQWVDTVGRVIVDNPSPAGDWVVTVDAWYVPDGTQEYYGYVKVLESASPAWEAGVSVTTPTQATATLSLRYEEESLATETPQQWTITVPVGVPFTFDMDWEVTAFYVAGAYWIVEPTTAKLELVSGNTGYVVGEHGQGETWEASTQFVATEAGTYDDAFRFEIGGTNSLPLEFYFDVVAYEVPDGFEVRRETGDVLTPGAFYGSGFHAGSADLAEWVEVSEPVEAGHVLEIDPTRANTYRLARGPCTPAVAGVVSTAPGMVLGSPPTTDHPLPTTHALLALLGVVPVKVTDEGGPIAIGDLLVVSSTPGHAMRWDPDSGDPCGLVGKALEPHQEGVGVVLALLTQ